MIKKGIGLLIMKEMGLLIMKGIGLLMMKGIRLLIMKGIGLFKKGLILTGQTHQLNHSSTPVEERKH